MAFSLSPWVRYSQSPDRQGSEIGSQLQSVSRQTSAFTELYFSSPSSRPALPAPSGSTAFEFSIVNHERSAITYRYVVTGDTPRSVPAN